MASKNFAQRFFAGNQDRPAAESNRVEPSFGEPVPVTSHINVPKRAAEPAAQRATEPATQRAIEPAAQRATEPATQRAIGMDAPVSRGADTGRLSHPVELKPYNSAAAASVDSSNDQFLALAAKYRVGADDNGRLGTDHDGASQPAAADHRPSAPVIGSERPMRHIEPVHEHEAAQVSAQAVGPRFDARGEPCVETQAPYAPFAPDAPGFSTRAISEPVAAASYDDIQARPLADCASGRHAGAGTDNEFVVSHRLPSLLTADDADQSNAARTSTSTSTTASASASATPTKGVFVENRRVRHNDKQARFSLAPLLTFFGLTALVGLSGAVAYATFLAAPRTAEIPTIQHDLLDEKVIPSAAMRGGYQVPNLDLRVLQRDLSGLNQFTSTRAAPAPEQPMLFPGQSTPGDDGTDTLTGATTLGDQPLTSLSVVGPARGASAPALPRQRPSLVPSRADGAVFGGVPGEGASVDAGVTKPLTLGFDQPFTLDQDFSIVPTQLTLDTQVSGPTSDGADVFVPSEENPDYQDGEIPSRPIPSMIPATQVTNPWGLQITASRSPDNARRLWQDLRQSNLRLLGDLGFKIESVLSNGQTLYRLQVGPFPTRATALDVCAEMQKAYGGIGCFPVTGGR